MFKIEAKNLHKSFGITTVFKNINFRVENGVYGIAGSNGSGKSTLLKCMASLLKPTDGTLAWSYKQQPVESSGLKEHIGYVAPYINLYSEFTVLENLSFIARLRGLDITSDAVSKWFKICETESFLNQPVGKLSTGQQQRARLASALFFNPPCLFLDEPGANMDRRGRNLIRQITGIWKQKNGLLILASNQPEELEICDFILTVTDDNPQFLKAGN